MKEIILTMKEKDIYTTIKKLVETNGNKNRAAIKLGCTTRNINILINKYMNEGKAGFSHKNKERKPARTIPEIEKERIIKLYKDKYYDFNWTHYKEKLQECEGIVISYTPLVHILTNAGFISPTCHKSTRRKKRKELEQKKVLTTVDKNLIISDHILDSEDAHPRRPRAKYFGELIQMDASGILWFNNTYSTLHLAVDDSTGTVVGAYFTKEETLEGYYNVFKQILTRYGIPAKFFTDNRTVFTYNSKADPTAEHDTYTQFAYACKSLGVEIQTSSIPQTKGRVERLNQTFQKRLPQEMRIARIKSVEEANEFLDSYVKEFNKRFALHRNNITSVFEKQPSTEIINQTLAILTPRKFDSGSSIKFRKEYYQAVEGFLDNVVCFMKGTEGLVIEAFNKDLFISVDNKVYRLVKVPEHKLISSDFDEPVIREPKKHYVPPMSHPWKRKSFIEFMQKQKHRQDVPVGANV